VAVESTEAALRWEARQGPRAAIAAALSAVLDIGSGIATAAVFNGAPVSGLADSLARAGRPGGVGSLQSLRTPYFEFYDDRAATVLLTAVARGLGFVAVAFMLTYLGTAVRNRTPAFRRMWLYVAFGGGLLGAIATIMFTIGTSVEIANFLDGPRTVDRADDIGNSSLLVTAQLIGIPGTQAIGLGPPPRSRSASAGS
jgi:heme A synthase